MFDAAAPAGPGDSSTPFYAFDDAVRPNQEVMMDASKLPIAAGGLSPFLEDADRLIAATADLAATPAAVLVRTAILEALPGLRFLRSRLEDDTRVLAEVMEMIDHRLTLLDGKLAGDGPIDARERLALRRERLELEIERRDVTARFGPRVARALERFYAALCDHLASLPDELFQIFAGDATRLDPDIAAMLDPLTLDLVAAERRQVFLPDAAAAHVRRRMAALVIGQRFLLELTPQHRAAFAELVAACEALALDERAAAEGVANDGSATKAAEMGAAAQLTLDRLAGRIDAVLSVLRSVGGAG